MFDPYEIVSERIYRIYGQYSWHFIDPQIKNALFKLRKRYDCPMFVNDWYWGGGNDSRGYRDPYDRDGALLSQHKLGKAFDISARDFSAEEIFEDIKNNQELMYSFGIRRMENVEFTPTWIHIDCKPTSIKNEIYIFNP